MSPVGAHLFYRKTPPSWSNLLHFFGFALLLALMASAFPQLTSAAQSQYRLLHGFGGPPDGQGPTAPVVVDGSGNLFGTTYFGGSIDRGSAFELIPNGTTGMWTKTIIHSFCVTTPCTDGAYPDGGVVLDPAGNLFGTASASNTGGGLVYKLSYDPVAAKWTEKVLYNFCSQPSCADGQEAESGLLLDAAGNLYGMTTQGGANGAGVVYELTPNATHTRYAEKVLYSFCSKASCTDGGYPFLARLIMDAAGNIYGTTRNGGNGTQSGVVFELIHNAAKTIWTEKALYTFCSLTNCVDGSVPDSGVIMDGAGNLFGTTSKSADVGGLVYELVKNATSGVWSEKIIRDFCATPPCTLGIAANGELAFDGSGRLIGTATADTPVNNSDNGIIFSLNPNTAHTRWMLSKLATFCGAIGCQAYIASSGVTIDSSGNMFGTTYNGGKLHIGSAFEYVSP